MDSGGKGEWWKGGRHRRDRTAGVSIRVSEAAVDSPRGPGRPATRRAHGSQGAGRSWMTVSLSPSEAPSCFSVPVTPSHLTRPLGDEVVPRIRASEERPGAEPFCTAHGRSSSPPLPPPLPPTYSRNHKSDARALHVLGVRTPVVIWPPWNSRPGGVQACQRWRRDGG